MVAKELHLCKPVRRCAPAASRAYTYLPYLSERPYVCARVYMCSACECLPKQRNSVACVYISIAGQATPLLLLPPRPLSTTSRRVHPPTPCSFLVLSTYSNYCAPPHMCVFVVRFRAGWYACAANTDNYGPASSHVFVCIRVPYMPRPIVSARTTGGGKLRHLTGVIL